MELSLEQRRKNPGPEKEKYKFKHSYSEVYHSSKPKILLLETLEN